MQQSNRLRCCGIVALSVKMESFFLLNLSLAGRNFPREVRAVRRRYLLLEDSEFSGHRLFFVKERRKLLYYVKLKCHREMLLLNQILPFTDDSPLRGPSIHGTPCTVWLTAAASSNAPPSGVWATRAPWGLGLIPPFHYRGKQKMDIKKLVEVCDKIDQPWRH